MRGQRRWHTGNGVNGAHTVPTRNDSMLCTQVYTRNYGTRLGHWTVSKGGTDVDDIWCWPENGTLSLVCLGCQSLACDLTGHHFKLDACGLFSYACHNTCEDAFSQKRLACGAWRISRASASVAVAAARLSFRWMSARCTLDHFHHPSS